MNPTIEILYPETCNLFGDYGNIQYLKKCLPNAVFVETTLNETPHFVSEKIDLIYMGPMTEKTQILVVERLRKYRDKIIELIDNGTCFLVTGNALEIFGKKITDNKTGVTECLDILGLSATRDMLKRYGGIIKGEFNNITLTGFRAQFTKCTLEENEKPFLAISKGVSMNDTEKIDGIIKNNFIGTYMLGPILILNPDFTKYLLKKITNEDVPLAFEKEVYDAYKTRLDEFVNPNTKIH